MIGDFYSQWADPYESVMIPLPIYMWTKRGNDGEMSDREDYDPQVNIQDSFWFAGFDGKYYDPTTGARETRRDILGNKILPYGKYEGNPGYFSADSQPEANKGIVEKYLRLTCQDARTVPFCLQGEGLPRIC